MRDFYWILKSLGKELKKENIGTEFTSSEFYKKIDKHFSGIYYWKNNEKNYSNEMFKKLVREKINSIEHSKLKMKNDSSTRIVKPNPLKFIRESYTKPNSRFIMLFLESSVSRALVLEYIKKHKSKRKAEKGSKIIKMFGSKFDFDIRSSKYYIGLISQLKNYVVNGDFLIFSNLEAIYGILYDLFNQRFSVIQNQINFCEINYGDIKDRIQINKHFGCLLLKNEKDLQIKNNIEKHLPSPLLNRFEKHILTLDHFKTDLIIITKSEIDQIKNVIRDCLLNDQIFSKDELKRDWTQRANELIFSFHNGELVDYLCVKWDGHMVEKKMKLTNTNETVTKFEKIFQDLNKFFSSRMLILFMEYLTKRGLSRRISKQFKAIFLQQHKLNSLEDFVNDYQQKIKNKVSDHNRFVIFTFSNITLQMREDHQIITSKKLENKGSLYLEQLLNECKTNLFMIYFENSNQFKHFIHLKSYVDFWMEVNKKNNKFLTVVFIVNQKGQGETNEVFHSDKDFKSEKNIVWKNVFIENLSSSYYQ